MLLNEQVCIFSCLYKKEKETDILAKETWLRYFLFY